ncbi:MAG: hypothetical protein ACI9G1_003114, partial [Pirellulaceae bacterium]
MRQVISIFTVAICYFLALGISSAEEPSKAELEFFETKIRPVLVKHCYKCHSKDSKEPKGGLLLDSREGIRRGGDSGHGVVPGELAESLVIDAIHFETLEMPPNQQLPESVIKDFEKWVELGAPDPREGPSLIQSKIDFEKAKTYWAYQPIGKPADPKIENTAWPRTKIDEFILARLEAKQLKPAKDADPLTLVRRVYIDLTGIPPTPEQVDEFLESCEGDSVPSKALERIIDKLLATSQYGERWGRHWLDVARYGESTGMERNYTFPQAWRYRDYVIASTNADKPYDQFIKEQIAGDLLPAEDADERLANMVATGFLAIGPKSLNERNREQFAMDIVDDQIDVTSRAFLGLTVSCARCHDHKFDAIPQAEYYAMAGIFRSTNTFYGTGGGGGNRQAGSLLGVSGMNVAATSVGGGNTKVKKNNNKQLNSQIKKLETQLARAKKSKASPEVETRVAKLKKQLAQLKKRLLKTEEAPRPKPKQADGDVKAVLVMGVQDSSNPSDTELRVRGEPDVRGNRIPRGFLTVASHANSEIPSAVSGRLQLAEWIANAENPLTARVAVNRVWQHLFGKGIVVSLNNFGNNGDVPSHPQLLDQLATDFSQEGWSRKRLIKQIMMSRTYQQSCVGERDLSE